MDILHDYLSEPIRQFRLGIIVQLFILLIAFRSLYISQESINLMNKTKLLSDLYRRLSESHKFLKNAEDILRKNPTQASEKLYEFHWDHISDLESEINKLLN